MASERVVTVAVAGSVLEVGRASGSEVVRVAEDPQAGELRRALEQDETGPRRVLAGAEALVDRADAVTGYVEDARTLLEALRDGAGLDAATTAVDRLLAVVDALDRDDRFEGVIRVGRVLHSVVALVRRWDALLSLLRKVERAGEATGDLASSGWALHERGTLELVAGRTREANRCLSRALELRTRAGDVAGAGATRRALQRLCEVLRARTELARTQRTAGLSRLQRRLAAALAVVFLLLGAAIGAALSPPARDGELTLQVQVTGAGTVRSHPAGIECRPRCARRFARGGPVALAATPDAGWEFRGWRGAGCAGTGPCAVGGDGDRSLSARFARVRDRAGATLTLSVSGDGRVVSEPSGLDCRPRCVATFRRGTVVTLLPQDGALRRWTRDCATADRCRVRMDGPRTIGARFDARVETVTLVVNAPNGRVVSDPAGIDCGRTCSAEFPRGAAVALLAQAASGHGFRRWSAPCGSGRRCALTLDEDTTITASYEPLPAPPRLTVAGSRNGTVTSADGLISCGARCGAGYARGTTVTLAATAADGWYLRAWEGCDRVDADRCSVTLQADRTVTPRFEDIEG